MKISNLCESADIILGDLNLNPSKPDEMSKLNSLCGEEKFMALQEQTMVNGHQLDHILINKTMKMTSYATSYLNFCADHRSICLRFANSDNEFIDMFLKKQYFSSDYHLKKRSLNVKSDSQKDISHKEENRGGLLPKEVSAHQNKILCDSLNISKGSNAPQLKILRLENVPGKLFQCSSCLIEYPIRFEAV